MSKEARTTTSQTLDPRSERYVGAGRDIAIGGLNDVLNAEGSFFVGPETRSPAELMAPFANPYNAQVIDAVRGEYDLLRDQARTGVSQGATAAGGAALHGGSRAGVAEGVRLGEIDRAQAGQVAGLLSDSFWKSLDAGMGFADRNRMLEQQRLQEPLFRRQAALDLFERGRGPVGYTSENVERGSTAGTLGGLALTGIGLATGNPAAAAGGASRLFSGGSAANTPAFTEPLFPRTAGPGVGLRANQPGLHPLWR